VEDAVVRIAGGYLLGTSCPPTDLDAIGAKLGITGFEAADIAGAGEIRRDGEGLRIFYSNYLSAERRRFTIAHEMGHAILERTGSNVPRHGKEVERLCDMFAVELLMPKQLFLDRARGKISTQRILEMAHHFRTSVATTGIRYAELFGVTVFALEDSKAIWGKGIFRPKPEDPIDDSFEPSIRKALEGETSSDEMFLNSDPSFRRWRLECSPFATGKSVLCLLQPASRSR
jgi:IrrE N-terminal-like domain